MKKILLSLLFFSLSINLFANGTSPLGALLIASGATVGATAGVVNALQLEELDGWKNQKINSTVDLSKTCNGEIIVQGELVGYHRMNFLKVSFTNNSDKKRVIDYENINFKFGDIRERFPRSLWGGGLSSITIDANWWIQFLVPFPTKSDFEKFSEIGVTIPISDKDGKHLCDGKLEFSKAKNLSENYLEYSLIDLSIELLFYNELSGNLKKVGRTESFSGGLDVSVYPWPEHGFGLGLQGTSVKSPDESISSSFEKGSDAEINLLMIYMSYNYRFRKEDVVYQSTSGVGINSIQEIIKEGNPESEDSDFGVIQKLSATYLFPKLAPSGEVFDFGLGLTFNMLYTPGLEVTGQDISGFQWSAGLRLSMGI